MKNEAGNFVLPLYDEDHGVAPCETLCGALFLHTKGDVGYGGGEHGCSEAQKDFPMKNNETDLNFFV